MEHPQMKYNPQQCQRSRRAGVTWLEVLLVLGVCTFLAALAAPWLISLRETSRQTTCRMRLKTLTLGLQQYHDTHSSYPPAAIWNAGVGGALSLHRSKRVDQMTHVNWAILLLPHLESSAPKIGAVDTPIGAEDWKKLRETRLPGMICPSDSENHSGKRFLFDRNPAQPPIEFARGNYAINGGSHSYDSEPPTTASSRGDVMTIIMQHQPRKYAMWGNGIAGINRAFRRDEMTNGLSTLVALEEVRAGIHPLDPRGVWPLGQIGSSITWGHGVNGDAAGPNNRWERSDDLLNCSRLHDSPGVDELLRQNMPCVRYVDVNQQATSRSQHQSGVHVSMADGQVRFLSDEIDPAVWHVLHSRETPADRLVDVFETADARTSGSVDSMPQNSVATWTRSTAPHREKFVRTTPEKIPAEISAVQTPDSPQQNSLEMTFVRVPAGRFMMGLPDSSNRTVVPADCAAHEVELTRDYWLGTHEVTRAQFASVLREQPLPDIPAIAEPETLSDEQIGKLPVTGMTWEQAQAFCEQLSSLPAEQQAGRNYRLPSEAEWEYACRELSASSGPAAGNRSASDLSGAAAGILPPLPLRPVGSYPASPLGFFDLRGNAWEWTNDWYARDYYAKSPRNDPQGPTTGEIKVVRGSDWRFIGEECLIDANALPPWKGNSVVGFRIVCEFLPVGQIEEETERVSREGM